MDQGHAAGRMSQNVLVLGGATEGGIGAAIVDRLTVLGHYVTAPDEDTVDILQPWGVSALELALDECQPTSVVYAIGVNELEWSWKIDRDSFDRVIAANVWGFIQLITSLQETGRAYSVLAITSDAAYRPMRTSIAYCASKAALDMAIRIASRELAVEGWRVNGLAPGKVEGTAMTRYVDNRVMEIRHFASREVAEQYEMFGNPLRRKLEASEVADVACDVLLSPVMGWTGDIVTVNGGR